MIPVVHDQRQGFLGRHYDSIATFWSCRASVAFQAEEDPAIPAHASDIACDGRKGFVGTPLKLETVSAHGDAVLDALPFPD